MASSPHSHSSICICRERTKVTRTVLALAVAAGHHPLGHGGVVGRHLLRRHRRGDRAYGVNHSSCARADWAQGAASGRAALLRRGMCCERAKCSWLCLLVLTAHPDLHRPTASRMRRILCLRCATGSPVSLATAHLRVAVGAKMMPSPRRSTL